ncbi:MAG: molybdopterin cofactor-binding domain-containing protein [Beijerinckiaceae bacterium]
MAAQDINISRRAILAGSAGLSFVFAFGLKTDAGAQPAGGRMNAYVRIAVDGTITIINPAAEMGQGVNTALPLIIAEELDADWSKVKVEPAPIDEVYNHPILRTQMVVASISVRGFWMPCRMAGAQARRVLMEAAAGRWGVPVDQLSTEPSAVVHKASNRRLSYGEIAAFATAPGKPPEIKPEQLKPVSQFRLLGKDVTRVDVAAKSTGGEIYAIDVRVPGMLYGTIARRPVRDSGPVSFNGDEVKAMPGIVEVVALEQGVGVIGESAEAVFAARAKLKVQWKDAPGFRMNSEAARAEYLARVRNPQEKGVVGRSTGNAMDAIASAARVHTSDFTTDYVYHAQMEPHACVASVTPDGLELWAGTQWPSRAVADAAAAAGVKPDKVKFHHLTMGGGYGRNAFVEYAVDATQLSRAVGRPVKMIQTREDDLANGRFRPMTAQRIVVALDSAGRVTGWRHRIAADTIVPYLYGQARMDAQKGVDHIVVYGADMPQYDVPNHVAEHLYEERGVRTAAWRGIGAGHNNFAIEVVVDELARMAKQDPVAYRLAFLKDPRARAVVQKAAQMADFTRAREGRGLGIAFSKLGAPPIGFSMIATVAEVSVDRATGRISVHNLWMAADVGLPLQPSNIVAQIEGAAIYSLGAALKEKVTIRNGVVEQTNFNDYEIMRLSEIPQMQVELIPSGETPLPVGELSMGATAPAIANAVHALTGRQLRHAPFTPERVRETMS